MNEETQAFRNDLAQLAADTHALMTTTADVAGEKVAVARRRVLAALERSRKIAGTVRDQAVSGARATDAAVQAHSYQAIAIGVGIGAILGFLVARQDPRNRG